MEFSKEDFNGFFKNTLDVVMESDFSEINQKTKIAFYKVLVKNFHYFVYFALCKRAAASNSYTENSLKILNGIFDKAKEGKFECKIKKTNFEVSLETVANLLVLPQNKNINNLSQFSSENQLKLKDFFNFFIEKNFEIEDQYFKKFLGEVTERLNVSQNQHLSSIEQAFKDVNEDKVFHFQQESRPFSAYTRIGESVQKQSTSTNAGWQERLEWIIDKFASYYIDSKPYRITPVAHSHQNNMLRPDFAILFGPPGTGKTREIKNRISSGNYKEFKILQIHPSYSYEDLVEGIRPVTFSDGELRYDVVEGPIRILAHKASGKPTNILVSIRKNDVGYEISLPVQSSQRYNIHKIQIGESIQSMTASAPKTPECDRIVLTEDEMKSSLPVAHAKLQLLTPESSIFQKLLVKDIDWGLGRYALVLDEINRGNLASLLGELVYLLGEDGTEPTFPVRLQYSQDEFLWPRNLSLLGTMNSADISTDRIDQAIKRRFSFEYIGPIPALFAASNVSFGFLDQFNQKMTYEIPNFTKIETINELFKYFGATKTPQEILTSINNSILNGADEFRILQPNERLIGHSYFLKLARRLCESDSMKEELRQATLFYELLVTLREELLPALLGVFNSDHGAVKQFLIKTFGYKGGLDIHKIDSLESWIEKIIFSNDQATVTTLDVYREMKSKKWPYAA